MDPRLLGLVPGYNIVQHLFDKNNTILLGITVDNIPTLSRLDEPEFAHLVRPGVEGGDVVDGDPEQDGIVLVEEILDDVVAGPLVRADGGPCRGYEGNHHVLFTPVRLTVTFWRAMEESMKSGAVSPTLTFRTLSTGFSSPVE